MQLRNCSVSKVDDICNVPSREHSFSYFISIILFKIYNSCNRLLFCLDSDGDNFNIVNEKGFELFLKYGGSKLYISRKNAPTPAESSGPIKVSVNQKGDFHREYINYVANWNSLLKEIQSTFDLVFAGIDYRMFWRGESL